MQPTELARTIAAWPELDNGYKILKRTITCNKLPTDHTWRKQRMSRTYRHYLVRSGSHRADKDDLRGQGHADGPPSAWCTNSTRQSLRPPRLAHNPRTHSCGQSVGQGVVR